MRVVMKKTKKHGDNTFIPKYISIMGTITCVEKGPKLSGIYVGAMFDMASSIYCPQS